MKAFFERYSYDSVRLLLNQVAISMFGFALAMSSLKTESDTLLLWSSIASIVFYLALVYGSAWKTGSNDRLSVEYGKIPFKPLRGLLIALLANSINFLLAILIAVGTLFGLGGLEGIANAIALLGQGMYQGVLAVGSIGGTALNAYWWVYFLLPLPAMLVATVAYLAGVKDFHVTNAGIPELPESDRPSRKELKEQRELEKKNKK